VKWNKAEPGQELEDGDNILVTGQIPGHKRWYEVISIACDSEFFALNDYNGEPSDLDWSDVDYWCHTRDIPPPEEKDIHTGPVFILPRPRIKKIEGTK